MCVCMYVVCMCVNVSMYIFIGQLSVGGDYYDFCSLSTALGKKLFRSLLVCVLGVLNLPEGRVVKKEFPGYEESCWMFMARVRRRFEWMSQVWKWGPDNPFSCLHNPLQFFFCLQQCNWNTTQYSSMLEHFLLYSGRSWSAASGEACCVSGSSGRTVS